MSRAVRRERAPARAPGQALVEMALVTLILLTVILGAADVLQIQMTQYTVAQAARAAAHQAALVGGPDGANGSLGSAAPAASGSIAEVARTILDSGMVTDPARATITVACASKPCRRYSAVTVRISYQDALWVPLGPLQDVQADIRATRASERDQQ